MSKTKQIEKLESDVRALRDCLSTLIAWTVQSAASPISQREAKMLLARIEPPEAQP